MVVVEVCVDVEGFLQFPSSYSESIVFPPKMHVPCLLAVFTALLHPHGYMHSAPHSNRWHGKLVDVDVDEVVVVVVVAVVVVVVVVVVAVEVSTSWLVTYVQQRSEAKSVDDLEQIGGFAPSLSFDPHATHIPPSQ